jgi:hypothetical protein
MNEIEKISRVRQAVGCSSDYAKWLLTQNNWDISNSIEAAKEHYPFVSYGVMGPMPEETARMVHDAVKTTQRTIQLLKENANDSNTVDNAIVPESE